MEPPGWKDLPTAPPTNKGGLRFKRGLRMTCNSLKTWWPGTELNRRRQPFQGCALPPELPGHIRAHSLSGDNRPNIGTALQRRDIHCEAGTIITTWLGFAQRPAITCDHPLASVCRKPFITVSRQRFSPNQYAISR